MDPKDFFINGRRNDYVGNILCRDRSIHHRDISFVPPPSKEPTVGGLVQSTPPLQNDRDRQNATHEESVFHSPMAIPKNTLSNLRKGFWGDYIRDSAESLGSHCPDTVLSQRKRLDASQIPDTPVSQARSTPSGSGESYQQNPSRFMPCDHAILQMHVSLDSFASVPSLESTEKDSGSDRSACSREIVDQKPLAKHINNAPRQQEVAPLTLSPFTGHRKSLSFQSQKSFRLEKNVSTKFMNGSQNCGSVATGRSRSTTIEVAPGEFLPLRGATETWEAIQNDYYVPSTCKVCGSTAFCIADASFVLCPCCQSVGPIRGDCNRTNMPPGTHNKTHGGGERGGGVGLGFTLGQLASWQDEISKARLRAPIRR